MTRYRDLSPCRYSHDALDADAWQVPHLTIGWLEFPFLYDRGRTPPDVLPSLEALAHGAQRHRLRILAALGVRVRLRFQRAA